MSNALAKKDIYLDLSIDDDGFDFATSIDDALAQAEAELVVLNETVESIKELKPQCDKLDYILAASSGALCGVIDIFLVGKPGESPIGDITDKWFANRTMDFAKLCHPDKKYLPKAFYAPDQLEKMAGVYFPYWLYDCQVEGELEGEGRTQKLWTEGNIRFTRTEKYDINRKGTMEIHNLTRNALSKGNRKLVEGVMPFDMTQMQSFQMGYLSGFLAENRDMEKERFVQEVGAEVSAFAEQSLKSSVSGYDSVQYRRKETRVCDSRWRYVLMPVWTMTYKDPKTDKIYYFACNGQTGKVCGELPVDPGRLAVLFLSCFVPLLAVLLVIGYWI